MSDNISLVGKVGIHWKEDQPVTRKVRQEMEMDGTIQTLVGLLLMAKNSKEIRQTNTYKGSGGVEQDYLCLVSRFPEEFRGESSPDCTVHIKPDIAEQPWDAIGDVYVYNVPRWIAEAAK